MHRPLATAAALVLLAVAAGLILLRRELAALPLRPLLVGLTVALPFAALIGPIAGVPAAPQLFFFRLLLIAVAALTVPVLLLSEARDVAPDRWLPALPLALWVAWLCLALLWAPDKVAGFTYLDPPRDDALGLGGDRHRRPDAAAASSPSGSR